jgi:hypothetical protein
MSLLHGRVRGDRVKVILHDQLLLFSMNQCDIEIFYKLLPSIYRVFYEFALIRTNICCAILNFGGSVVQWLLLYRGSNGVDSLIASGWCAFRLIPLLKED